MTEKPKFFLSCSSRCFVFGFASAPHPALIRPREEGLDGSFSRSIFGSFHPALRPCFSFLASLLRNAFEGPLRLSPTCHLAYLSTTEVVALLRLWGGRKILR